jgi:hypothetical protein
MGEELLMGQVKYHLNNPGLKAPALMGCHNGGTLA